MLAEKLREQREKRGLSQGDMGAALQITRQAYSHYENGKREPSPGVLKKIAEILECSLDYLLEKDATPSLDEQLSDIDFALYGEVQDLTDEEKQDVLDYIRYKKSKNKN